MNSLQSMLDRAAEAAIRHECKIDPHDKLIPSRAMEEWGRSIAYSIILSLRSPTLEVLTAGCSSHPPKAYSSDTSLGEIILAEWDAMIGKILSE